MKNKKKQKGGNCTNPVSDCFNQNLEQMGSIPSKPSASEIAFSNRSCCPGQIGGGNGYYFDYKDCGIGGQPVVKSYNDKCPPVFVGELLMKGGKKRKKVKKTVRKKRSKKSIKKK